VRFRPSPWLATEDFKTLLIPSAHCRVYNQGIFSDYLTASDLLVSYSSTTIEEALLNRVPVLQYDPHGKYMHVPGHTLDSERHPDVASCYYVGSEANLGWALSWVVNHHHQGKKLPASIWHQHAFSDDELEDVFVYFEKQRAMGFP
jgi:creatinine amidohydrolase/Fe(II)-dependent formamide hydrolase-like protein